MKKGENGRSRDFLKDGKYCPYCGRKLVSVLKHGGKIIRNSVMITTPVGKIKIKCIYCKRNVLIPGFMVDKEHIENEMFCKYIKNGRKS